MKALVASSYVWGILDKLFPRPLEGSDILQYELDIVYYCRIGMPLEHVFLLETFHITSHSEMCKNPFRLFLKVLAWELVD